MESEQDIDNWQDPQQLPQLESVSHQQKLPFSKNLTETSQLIKPEMKSPATFSQLQSKHPIITQNTQEMKLYLNELDCPYHIKSYIHDKCHNNTLRTIFNCCKKIFRSMNQLTLKNFNKEFLQKINQKYLQISSISQKIKKTTQKEKKKIPQCNYLYIHIFFLNIFQEIDGLQFIQLVFESLFGEKNKYKWDQKRSKRLQKNGDKNFGDYDQLYHKKIFITYMFKFIEIIEKKITQVTLKQLYQKKVNNSGKIPKSLRSKRIKN